MSSPFQIPGSSPFPLLPIPNLANSPLPIPLGQGAASGATAVVAPGPGALHAPSPLTQLLASGLATSGTPGLPGQGGVATPGAFGFPPASAPAPAPGGLSGPAPPSSVGVGMGTSPNYPFPGLTPNTSAMLAASLAAAAAAGAGPGASSSGIPASTQGPNGESVPDMIRGLEHVEGMLERLSNIGREADEVQSTLFVSGGGTTGEHRLEVLNAEYAQILLALLGQAQTTLLGALPCSSSSTTPSHNTTSVPFPADGQDSTVPAPDPMFASFPDLIAWTEDRAALEFSRREGIKHSSKAVLDVLRSASASITNTNTNTTAATGR